MGMISVNQVGKAYKQYASRWGRLIEWLLFNRKRCHQLKWVMEDVSFTINPGEAVGIIGVNGAGKSTLLKMITGTTQPTTGSITTTGRVAALLELGMGFHPDFTGRQNAFMAGQLLGLRVEEIAELMPDIERFAEIGDYMDRPVRVYSSGMMMRVAFSIATARRPDILIVDEALSVGDAYFQHKSFSRIREFRKQGTTLLLVSHDKGAIQSICNRAILLNAGRLAMEGEPEAVMDCYNALLAVDHKQVVRQTKLNTGQIQTTSGSGEATVTRIALMNDEDEPIDLVDVGQAVCLKVEVAVHADLELLVFGYGIKDRLGQVIYGTNTELKSQSLHHVKAGSNYVFRVFFSANLGPGTYSLQTALTGSYSHLANNYEWRDLAHIFNVVNVNKPHFEGTNWMDTSMRIIEQ